MDTFIKPLPCGTEVGPFFLMAVFHPAETEPVWSRGKYTESWRKGVGGMSFKLEALLFHNTNFIQSKLFFMGLF